MDPLSQRYDIDPPNLQDHCNLCGMKFDICHALDCNKGGLIMAHHSKIRDGVVNLSIKAFTSTYVRDDLKIYTGCALCGGK